MKAPEPTAGRRLVLASTSRAADGGYLALADLASAICIKALAYRGRYADKDAVDLWRLMNAAQSAGLHADTWPSTQTGHQAAAALHQFFGRPGAAGLRQATRTPAEQTRMRALTHAVVPRLA